jgi:hypothetical protein
MVSLEQFRRANPGVYIGDGEGKWLVVYCRGRGVRYTDFSIAQKEAREGCACCTDGATHQIVEIFEPKAPGISRSFQRMIESA